MKTVRILLVEDDRSLGQRLRRSLVQVGYSVQLVTSNADAKSALPTEAWSLIILDWMLPDGNGLETLKQLRAMGSRTPVIFLTARGEVEDRVAGLDAGADDYLTKPFAFSELLARIRTLFRRGEVDTQSRIRINPIEIDLVSRKVLFEGFAIQLTPREYDLLAYLAVRRGDAVSRETLAREVWDAENRFTSLDNVIDVHIANLRKKLRERTSMDLIQTIRGVGFRIQGI